MAPRIMEPGTPMGIGRPQLASRDSGMPGFLDEGAQRPGVAQEVVHPLPQTVAIVIAIHIPSAEPAALGNPRKHH
jgi:hypothetical protein